MNSWALLGILLLIAACNNQENFLFQCKGGQMVSDPQDCPELQEQPPRAGTEPETPTPNETAVAPPANATPPPAPTTPSAPFNRTIAGVPEKNITIPEGNYVSLKSWSLQEIVEAMATYNDKFSHIRFWTLRYEERNSPFYKVGSSNTLSEDPFYMLRSQYAAGTKESLEYLGFRIDVTPTPEDLLNLIGEKHNDTKFKLVYPEQWVLYAQIECAVEQSCRNIEAIHCTHDTGHDLYVWLPRDPNIGYTEDTKYTMMSLDDNREVLTTFEQFYCTPI